MRLRTSQEINGNGDALQNHYPKARKIQENPQLPCDYSKTVTSDLCIMQRDIAADKFQFGFSKAIMVRKAILDNQ